MVLSFQSSAMCHRHKSEPPRPKVKGTTEFREMICPTALTTAMPTSSSPSFLTALMGAAARMELQEARSSSWRPI